MGILFIRQIRLTKYREGFLIGKVKIQLLQEKNCIYSLIIRTSYQKRLKSTIIFVHLPLYKDKKSFHILTQVFNSTEEKVYLR